MKTLTHTLDLDPYLTHVRALPFVRGAGLEPHDGPGEADADLVLKTPSGVHRFRVEARRSALSYALADRVLAHARDGKGAWILFAPYVPPPMGRYLAERGANFIDAVGNCHLGIGDQHVARIEGRKPERTTDRRAVRATGYRVLFAVLARPELVNAPVRKLAEAAGVGKSAAAEMVARLTHEGFAARSGERRALLRPRQLLDRWLVGYADVLRPRLLVGRFEAPERDPAALERRIEEALGDTPGWAWGGAAAAFRLTRHFRGEQTLLHMSDPPADLARRLRLLPAREGRVVVVRPPGRLGLEAVEPRTAHPLLVYAELMTTGGERERETGAEILERFLPALQ